MNSKQKEQIRELVKLRQTAYTAVLAELARTTILEEVKRTLALVRNPKAIGNAASRTPEEITDSILQNYLSNLNKGGSQCVDRVIHDNGNGTYTCTTEQKFIPWLNDLTDDLSNDILDIIGQSESAGVYPLDIAKQISGYMEGTKHRAVTAARTEAQKIRSDARFATFEDQGVQYVQYVTVGDDAVRPEHAARDGKIYRIEDAPYLGEYNCRCTVTPADYKVKMKGAEVTPTDAITLTEEELTGEKAIPQPKESTATLPYGRNEEKPKQEYGEYGALMTDKQLSTITEGLSEAMPEAEIETSVGELDYKVLKGSIKAMKAISSTKEGAKALSIVDNITTTKRDDIFMGVSVNKAGEVELQYSLKHYTPAMVKESADKLKSATGLVGGTTLESAINHETGHLMYLQYLSHVYKGDTKAIYADWVKATTKIKDTDSAFKREEIIKQWDETAAYKLLFKAGALSDLKAISQYATVNYSEAIAEAVADVLQNKGAASEASKKIYKVINQELINSGVNKR